ncbi:MULTISPECIES: hypothetical protein [Amycolatopsis]|uniref:hypothetical protein n=1 Tax=Amycolatopsis TaxID=1813 RepID=UPI001C57EB75|nr:hypothetical protein [Amycolatopsis sp. TNS106]QXV55935.1 hypothetical protein CVV72_02150 [Amycolatopsis sp. TNS106]
MTDEIERAAHAYCPACNPDPGLGERVTALCGATHPYWGRRERPVNNCPACVAVVAKTVYPCGHPGGGR